MDEEKAASNCSRSSLGDVALGGGAAATTGAAEALGNVIPLDICFLAWNIH